MPAELLEAEAALPGLLAEKVLLERGHRTFDAETVHKLVLLSTGSQAEADDAAARRDQQRMDEADAMNGRK